MYVSTQMTSTSTACKIHLKSCIRTHTHTARAQRGTQTHTQMNTGTLGVSQLTLMINGAYVNTRPMKLLSKMHTVRSATVGARMMMAI